jgi:phosphate transport system protein
VTTAHAEPPPETPPTLAGAHEINDSLDRLDARMLEALDLVAVALECSVEAIRRRDVELARMVVGDDDYTDARYVAVNRGVLASFSRRSPDPVQVRRGMGLLRVSRHVERIGDHCVNLAKLVRLDGRAASTDAGLLDHIGRMGSLAHEQLWQSKVAFSKRDVDLAEDLVKRDQELNQLNRACFRLALELGGDAQRRAWAMHMMLAARWLERIGDNAVDIGEAAAFIATGTAREFTDSSRGA